MSPIKNKTEEIKTGLLEFLELIESDVSPISDDKLILILDKLALYSNYADDKIFDNNKYLDAPKIDNNFIRDKLSNKFPEYGMYNIPLDITNNLATTEIGTGDAIDDLLDIYRELKEVDWRFKKTSEEDALWYFNWSYRSELGFHLRDLQWYLYHLRYESKG